MSNLSATLRRFYLYLLIIPYAAYVIGMFSSYVTFYHRSSFQEQVAASNQPELKVLVFSGAEFEKIKWTEDQKEFEYMGKMYDVSKIERRGTQYRIYCENDSLEDLFIDWLKSAGKSKSKVTPQIQFVEPIVAFDCAIPFIENTPGRLFTSLYISFPGEITSPPPRFS